MAVSSIHNGWGFRQAGGRQGNAEISMYYEGSEGVRLNASVLSILDGVGLVVGHTAQLTISDGGGSTNLVPEVQMLGTGQADSSLLLATFSTTATRAAAPTLAFLKSGNAAIGSNTIVTDDEILGSIIAYGDDGADYESPAAAIEFAVDAAPGTGDMPGSIRIYLTADGGETLTERWRFLTTGVLTSVAGTPSNAATADGSVLATGGLAITDVANAWIDDATQGSGTVTHYIGNQTITTSSDMRIKENIQLWDQNALSFLRGAPRLVEFSWNDPADAVEFGRNSRGLYKGYIAQETIDWAPWIVNAGNAKDCAGCRAGDCEYWTPDGLGDHPTWHVQYDHLVPVIVEGIKVLDQRVTELQGAQEHVSNGWLKERFTDLVETDEGFRAWAREALTV